MLPSFTDALFLPTGLVLGTVLAATLFPGVVFVVQTTYSRGPTAGQLVARRLALAQAVLALPAAILVMLLLKAVLHWPWGWRPVAAGLLLLAAWQLWKGADVRALRLPPDFGHSSPAELGRLTFRRAVAMPGRGMTIAGQFACLGLGQFTIGGWAIPLQVLGFGLGAWLWFAFFAEVAKWSVKEQVPDDIALRSLNKLRRIGLLVLTVIAAMGLIPLAFPVM